MVFAAFEIRNKSSESSTNTLALVRTIKRTKEDNLFLPLTKEEAKCVSKRCTQSSCLFHNIYFG